MSAGWRREASAGSSSPSWILAGLKQSRFGPAGLRPRATTPARPIWRSEIFSAPNEASNFEARPAFRHQPLLRQEASLVIHLARVPHPVAEIDVGEAHTARARDVVQDHVSAERAVAVLGIVERVDHRQAVAEHVG